MADDRLTKLRKKMKAAGIDCYVIPTSDEHDSEYVSGFFQVREYFSGFTGSAGTLVVWAKKAALFTDGRYFIQAEKELEGSGITLMRMGEAQVPQLYVYLEQELKEGQTLAFDGRLINADEGRSYEKLMRSKQGKLLWNIDPADDIWKERPELTFHPVFELETGFCGQPAKAKLKQLREKMQELDAEIHILTTLDDISWLLNIRSYDVENCPVVLAFAVITMTDVMLFTGAEIEQKNLGDEIENYLYDIGVNTLPYEAFYEYVSEIHGKKVLLCQGRISYRLLQEIQQDVTILDKPNPTTLMKAIKNPVEMKNLRKAHLKDGVAVTHFMYWLKTNTGKTTLTEISAANYLAELRERLKNYVEPSFETICAYGANGAIIHYSASPEKCADILPGGLLMVDSGGHYLEGTTDITRTFAIGEVTKEMKTHFSLVLLAMLRLMNTKFLYGCRGVNLDIRAREILWKQGFDYKHGTGHGVGYLLNVHEGPNSFRWKLLPDYQENVILEEGMVTTDEPGIYIEGSHGVRIENELLCRKGIQNEYGQFMYFENLTWVPIDADAIDTSILGEEGTEWLNEYHRAVYEKLSPYFDGQELEWLKKVTDRLEYKSEKNT